MQTVTPEQRHMGRDFAALGCIVGRLGFTSECSGRTVVHHIRDGQGITDRADDFLVIPTCEAHHDRQPFGVHYAKSFRTRTRMTELDLLAATLRVAGGPASMVRNLLRKLDTCVDLRSDVRYCAARRRP